MSLPPSYRILRNSEPRSCTEAIPVPCDYDVHIFISRHVPIYHSTMLKQAEEAKIKSEYEKDVAEKETFEATFKDVEKPRESATLSDRDNDEEEDLTNKPIGPVKVKVSPGVGVGESEQEGIVKDMGDGSYTVTYVVPKRGNYMLSVECDGTTTSRFCSANELPAPMAPYADAMAGGEALVVCPLNMYYFLLLLSKVLYGLTSEISLAVGSALYVHGGFHEVRCVEDRFGSELQPDHEAHFGRARFPGRVRNAVWGCGENKSPGPVEVSRLEFFRHVGYRRCKHKKQQAMVFKVDFAKAYDSIRWDFLEDVLTAFGFGPKWCSWIRGCLHSVGVRSGLGGTIGKLMARLSNGKSKPFGRRVAYPP
ncbi:RNA-directed DNA polymerase, eukaryota [Tanacetum coccineum]|uniref:RNA-directed DNA polymerase, eukaryota n=1 Tax=Tanacetum coccineum TaxID=301880 RepID=A0ABQ4Y658_9ASTR